MKKVLDQFWNLTCLVLVVFGLMIFMMFWPVIFLPLIFLTEILGEILKAWFRG